MERTAVLVGDPPSSGGKVLQGPFTQVTVKGAPYATIGGDVQCAACNSVGVIAKAGGPYRAQMYGFEMALENDIVLCKCATPPKLIAKALAGGSPNVWVDDRLESLGAVPEPGANPFSAADQMATKPLGGQVLTKGVLKYDQQFMLIDAKDKPLAGIYYSVKIPTGKIVHGTTDGRGLTARYETDGAAVIAVYLGHIGVKLPTPLTEAASNTDPRSLVSAKSARLAKPWQLSGLGLDFVKDYERFEPAMYNDATGNATIGYGHLIHHGNISGATSEKPFLNGMTEADASNLLLKRMAEFESAINSSAHVPLHQNEYDALVIFAYNVGADGAANSRVLKAINMGVHQLAPDEMATWNKGRDPKTKLLVEMKGLINRRTDEIKIFKTADYKRSK